MKWISVNDKLPKKPGYYLVYTEEDGVFSAEYDPKIHGYQNYLRLNLKEI